MILCWPPFVVQTHYPWITSRAPFCYSHRRGVPGKCNPFSLSCYGSWIRFFTRESPSSNLKMFILAVTMSPTFVIQNLNTTTQITNVGVLPMPFAGGNVNEISSEQKKSGKNLSNVMWLLSWFRLRRCQWRSIPTRRPVNPREGGGLWWGCGDSRGGCGGAYSSTSYDQPSAVSDGLEFHSSDRQLEVDYRVSPGFQPQRHKGNPNNGLFIPLNKTVCMVLGYNAYNSAIMPDNGLITVHNCYQFQCDLEPVVKSTPDQLVVGSTPTRTSSPGTLPPWNESIGVKSTKPKNGPQDGQGDISKIIV